MSYQSTQHRLGSQANIKLITTHISSDSKTVLDIGCNEGLVSIALGNRGYDVTGIEASHQFYALAQKHKQASKLENCRFINDKVKMEDIDKFVDIDSILLLSVHHQLVEHLGIETGNTFLRKLFMAARKQLFFQPATIYAKYGQRMPFPENDLNSIREYFLKMFEDLRPFRFVDLGIAANYLPQHEPFRPLYLFEFDDVESPDKFRTPSTPEEFTASRSRIVQVPLEKCRGHFWQGFNRDGWHFLSAQLGALASNHVNRDNISQTPLSVYYAKFKPKTYNEASKMLGGEDMGLFGRQSPKHYMAINNAEACTNLTLVNALKNDKQPGPPIPDFDNYSCGPQKEDKVWNESSRLAQIFKKLSAEGYLPDLADDGFIRGQFIKQGDDWVFQATAGNHRLAVLRTLGYEWAECKIQYGQQGVIDLDQLRQSVATNDDGCANGMLRYFGQYLNQDGNTMARFLGLN